LKNPCSQPSGRLERLRVVAVCISSCLGFSAAAQTPPIPVTVSHVKRGNFPVMLDALGNVQALNSVLIRTRVDGQIEQVLFTEGQTVARGGLLIRLDARPFKAALDQAVAKRAQDQATLVNARIDLDRYANLARKTYAPVQQYDTQKAIVAADEAQVQADDAAIDAARTQLSYTEISSPIAGRVSLRLIDGGNIVHAADVQPLLSVVQVTPINVLFAVPENRVDELAQASSSGAVPVSVTTTDGKRKLAEGRISFLNNQVDLATGTMQVKAVFDNDPARLWPGQSVMAHVHISDLANVNSVPNKAIQRGQNGLFAWVLDQDGVATIKKLKVVGDTAGASAIEGDFAEGERIVTEGQSRLTPGAKTDAIDADAAADITKGAAK